MADDFIKEDAQEKDEEKEQVEEAEEIEEKVKVGDEEYTRDELKDLVGLGKMGREMEEKWDTKIDKVYPEFTKSRQELKELRETVEAREETQVKEKLAEGKELSPDEQRKVAREEAKRLGLLLDTDFNDMYAQRRAGERLTDSTESAVSNAEDKYGIKTTVKDVLQHMAKPESPKVPEKAIKDMFEPQIDKWKEEQLTSKKGDGLVTESASTAGGKEPSEVKITRDNLRDAVKEALGQG